MLKILQNYASISLVTSKLCYLSALDFSSTLFSPSCSWFLCPESINGSTVYSSWCDLKWEHWIIPTDVEDVPGLLILAESWVRLSWDSVKISISVFDFKIFYLFFDKVGRFLLFISLLYFLPFAPCVRYTCAWDKSYYYLHLNKLSN